MNQSSYFQSTKGAQIEYLIRDNDSRTTVFWFSAFTQGPRLGKILKSTPRFHGYRVSAESQEFNWVLIRDHAGFTNDGTYYGGTAGDLFIEDAVLELILSMKQKFTEKRVDARFISMGSSMGGYAAVKFAALGELDSGFVYSPHFDMKIAMHNCGRRPWIEWCLRSGTDSQKDEYLNRLQFVVEKKSDWISNIDLLVQATADDPYVYPEQVVPFIERFKAAGGTVELDLRERGGHTSIHTSNEYIYFVLSELSRGKLPKPELLGQFPQRKYSRTEKIEKTLQDFEHLVMKVLKFLHIR